MWGSLNSLPETSHLMPYKELGRTSKIRLEVRKFVTRDATSQKTFEVFQAWCGKELNSKGQICLEGKIIAASESSEESKRHWSF